MQINFCEYWKVIWKRCILVKRFLMFLKEDSHAYKTAFIWSNKNSNIMKYHCYLKKRFSILIFKSLFIPVMAKLDFQQPLLKCYMIRVS